MRDFALWKAAKPGEPSWSTAVGVGRPGWHIECSAMSMRHLGETFDIHTGGVDLIFPHHEDEIAQSEAATGREFVRTWLHCAHLQMGGQKMAKSVGNIARVGDLLGAGVSPRALRYALIAAHYRASLSYTDASLAAAAAAVERLDALYLALAGYREDRAADPTLEERSRSPGRVSRPASTTTSTSPRPWPPCSTWSATSTAGSTPARSRRPTPSGLARRSWPWTPCWVSRPRTPRNRSRPARRRCSTRAPPPGRPATGPPRDRLRDALAEQGIVVEDSRDGQRWRRAGTAADG